jgi:hypothetical protein
MGSLGLCGGGGSSSNERVHSTVGSLPCKHMHHRKAGQETACLSVMHFFWCIDGRGFILWSCVGHVLTWASWLSLSKYFVLQDVWYGKHVQLVAMWLGSLAFPCRLPCCPGQQFLFCVVQESRPCQLFIFPSTYPSLRGLLTPFLYAMARLVTTYRTCQSHSKKGTLILGNMSLACRCIDGCTALLG